jgi:hypothetical protein
MDTELTSHINLLQRCLNKPQSALFKMVHVRLRFLHHHLIALLEMLTNLERTVPMLTPYINRIAKLYMTMLRSPSPFDVLKQARMFHVRALDRSFFIYQDFVETEIPLNDITSAIESFQLMLQHHDYLMSTFTNGVYVDEEEEVNVSV